MWEFGFSEALIPFLFAAAVAQRACKKALELRNVYMPSADVCQYRRDRPFRPANFGFELLERRLEKYVWQCILLGGAHWLLAFGFGYVSPWWSYAVLIPFTAITLRFGVVTEPSRISSKVAQWEREEKECQRRRAEEDLVVWNIEMNA